MKEITTYNRRKSKAIDNQLGNLYLLKDGD